MANAVMDTEWYAEVPRSIFWPCTMGVLLFGLTFGGFGYWSVSAPLAAAVIAQGSFVASGQNKVVQHLEGGVIKQILVSEGDHVAVNQPLVHLDETAALAKERQIFLRQARLEAIAARLTAEYENRLAIRFPSIVSENLSDPEIAPIVESQRRHFDASRIKLKTEIGLLQQNIEALKFRRQGFDDQLLSVHQQYDLLNDELGAKKVLFAKGLLRLPELSALQRAMADAAGQAGRLKGEVAEASAQIVKFEKQIEQTGEAYRQAALDELQALEAELDSLRQQFQEAKNVLGRVTITAPVAGTIVRLYYHTDGGVIESGKSILEILPADVPLVIEAQVTRRDINDVKVGQKAAVRLVSLNQRTTPVLNGEVFYVSADAIPDQTAMNASKQVYLARVSISPSELGRVPGFRPTPGMPAEVMVQTAERTFLAYLSKPVTDIMARAFTEH